VGSKAAGKRGCGRRHKTGIRREQGNRAQSLLDRGLAISEHPTLLLDKAMIYDMHAGPGGFHRQYRQAEPPGGRIFSGACMRRTREKRPGARKAYIIFADLPDAAGHVPAAAKAIVWERMRELEDELKLPGRSACGIRRAAGGEKARATAAATRGD